MDESGVIERTPTQDSKTLNFTESKTEQKTWTDFILSKVKNEWVKMALVSSVLQFFLISGLEIAISVVDQVKL